MYQPAKTPVPAKRVQRLSRLESEYQQNQNHIRQLHRRNQELTEEIRHLSRSRMMPKSKNPAPNSPKSKNTKSLRRITHNLVAGLQATRLGRYSIMFWLQAGALLMGVGLVCGTAGFMFVRLITSFIS